MYMCSFIHTHNALTHIYPLLCAYSFMCMHTCIVPIHAWTCMHIRIYICMRIYAHTSKFDIYVHKNTTTHIHAYIQKAHIREYIYFHISIIHAHIYIDTHIHIHMHTWSLSSHSHPPLSSSLTEVQTSKSEALCESLSQPWAVQSWGQGIPSLAPCFSSASLPSSQQ